MAAFFSFFLGIGREEGKDKVVENIKTAAKLRSDIISCFHRINNKENTRLISESRILDLHKIMSSVLSNIISIFLLGVST